jgi:hypothetical protein
MGHYRLWDDFANPDLYACGVLETSEQWGCEWKYDEGFICCFIDKQGSFCVEHS